MDKRNFAFIALFSLSLLAINGGFHFWNQKQEQDYLAKKRVYAAQIQSKQRLQQSNYRIPTDKLDIVNLNDTNWGLRFNQMVLLLNPSKNQSIFEEKRVLAHSLSPQPYSLYSNANLESEQKWLQAVKIFKNSQALSQSITLVGRVGDLIQTFSAQIDPELKISSILNESLNEIDPSQLNDGIMLISHTGQVFPIGLFYKSGNDLNGFTFDNLEVIASKIRSLPSFEKESLEKFYLLENDYLQLVISSKGGAIAEINLPFDQKSPQSVVKEVKLDQEIKEASPENALFPLRAATYITHNEQQAEVQPQLGGYYPLLRRGLLGKNGWLKPLEPKDYALSLVSDYSEIENLDYKLIEFTGNKLVLEAAQPHRRITRTYQMPQKPVLEPYCFNTNVKIEGDKKGLWIGSGITEAEIGTAAPLPVIKYRQSQGHQVSIKNFDLPTDTIEVTSTRPDWVCTGNAFFGIFLDPIRNQFPGLKLQPIAQENVPSRLSLIDASNKRFSSSALTGYRMLLPVPNQESSFDLRVVAGPLADSVLKQLDQTFSDSASSYSPEYSSSLSFNGWFSFVLKPFSNFMMMLMSLFHTITKSWAAAILLLTVVLRLMLYPLNAWSNTSMKKMQELSPKIKALQERYKDDPKKQQMEMVLLYREHKVNPVSGCLPIVIQIPFLFSMMHIFKTNFSLRGASFIPGWIDDLAAPDVLFSWNYSLPFIGSDFHLLPILLGAAMFAQSLLMSPRTQEISETQRQQKAMSNIMTVAFTFMFYSLPSGLNIYWLASSLLGMAQQYWQQRVTSTTSAPIIVKGKKN